MIVFLGLALSGVSYGPKAYGAEGQDWLRQIEAQIRPKLPLKVSPTVVITDARAEPGLVWRTRVVYLDWARSEAGSPILRESVRRTTIDGAKEGDVRGSCAPGSNGRAMLDAGVTIMRNVVGRDGMEIGTYTVSLIDCPR
jgi:hypothetical protein